MNNNEYDSLNPAVMLNAFTFISLILFGTYNNS